MPSPLDSTIRSDARTLQPHENMTNSRTRRIWFAFLGNISAKREETRKDDPLGRRKYSCVPGTRAFVRGQTSVVRGPTGTPTLVAAPETLAVRPVTMEPRCFREKLEFQRYPPKDFCTAGYERKSSKKKFQTIQKSRKKKILGRFWAKIGLRKTQPNVCSKRRDFESWTDIDRQNQRLRHEI